MSRAALYADIFGLESRDFWRTPPEVIDALRAEFGAIGLDACALPDDAVAPAFIGPDEDCRVVDWGPRCRDGIAFLNPPYSARAGGLYSFVARAAQQSERWGLTVVLLAPPGVGSAYRVHARETGAEIRDLPRRLAFLHPDTGAPMRGNRDGSSIFVWNRSTR